MILKKSIFLIVIHFMVLLIPCFAQQETIEKDQYILGKEQKLEIVVHIWGEVKNPGEYLVPDGTDVLELISKAGGYTEYSNISNIRLTRGKIGSFALTDSNLQPEKFRDKSLSRVIKINLKKYLTNKKYEPLPLLQPGDAVTVGRNKWYAVQTMIRVISQIAIIAQAWYYYSQINE